ncbi:uncharacterized protein LOC115091953 [Rhinatrema bivittatum]|uniref:uncharacterized protein LOC115091953 n=1 Tax=Rhinatrema bivittatum TaxID=194408 RepID=UPI00112CF996|nr:uncharacterized protein LOC115091953 [Rhinatrema bivittatum]XP_029458201.1 uncharacterized protein LOC115091953 [Rhinatrema bivittatum]XP_029458202.1 uncharacterized protein LOC115091953 [Rhinatrema bivittatum]
MLEEMLPLVRLFFPGTASADTPGPSCKEAWRERMPEQTWGGDGRRQGRNEGAEGGDMIGSEERHQVKQQRVGLSKGAKKGKRRKGSSSESISESASTDTSSSGSSGSRGRVRKGGEGPSQDTGHPTLASLTELWEEVPKKLRCRIKKRKYVNIFKLLEGRRRVRKGKNKKKKGSVDDGLKVSKNMLNWVRGFFRLASVVGHYQPGQYGALLAYGDSIVGAFKDYEGWAWLNYDEKFRDKMEGNRFMSWGTQDINLWLTQMTNKSAGNVCPDYCLALDSHFHIYPQDPPNHLQLQEPKGLTNGGGGGGWYR